MLKTVLLTLLSLTVVACDLSSGGGSGSGGKSGGGGGDDVLADIPCGQILDCFALCDTEGCYQDCYDSANSDSQAIYDTLDTCFGDNGCDDWACMETRCGAELQVCEEDLPPGGYTCTAEGVYQVCDSSGYCDERLAVGAGWGSSEPAAGFWAEYDCSEFMQAIIAVTVTETASIVESCVAVSCGPG